MAALSPVETISAIIDDADTVILIAICVMIH